MENVKPAMPEEAGNNKQQDEAAEKTDILQHEKLIDPGNEHSHNIGDKEKAADNKEARFDAEPGDDNNESKTKKE